MPETVENRPVESNKLIWVYSLESDRLAGISAKGMALETDASVNKSRSANTLETKRRTFRLPGTFDITGSATSFYGANDDMVTKLESAIDTGELVNFWMINSAVQNEEEKFESEYFQGYLTTFSKTAGSNGSVEVQFEYALEAPGFKGWATLTEDQAEVVTEGFRDTVATV